MLVAPYAWVVGGWVDDESVWVCWVCLAVRRTSECIVVGCDVN